jgi:RHS repeat-associated protein
MEGAGGIGGLLARSYGYSSGSWSTHHLYHADGNGNITALVDSSQAVAASYRYDPFGNTLSSSGTLAATNVYRFSSKEVHGSSGMYCYLYRFYDPNLQRWINRDPREERGGINLQGFAGNDPVNDLDPYGEGIISCLVRSLPIVNGVLKLIDPPGLNGGITPKKCTLLWGGPITYGKGQQAERTCNYECRGPHPSDEPNTGPPPTIVIITIPPGYSCPSEPGLAPVPPIPPGTPVLRSAPPNSVPYPRPGPPSVPVF